MSIGRIPENILEDILGRVNIVEVIAGYIPLKRAGRNFKALCPFHHEKTASFMVSADRQIYHCFGCAKGGNAFHFLMEYERMEFPEAVQFLAKKCGVALPERQDAKTVSTTEKLYKINEIAANFFQQALNSQSGARAKDYLIKRGLSPETIKSFKLGFAYDHWDALMNSLRQKGVNLSLIEKSGLILSKQGGGYYDRFRKRITFPIFDIRSRVLAFGGRVLDQTLPKYVNSPETPIYIKGRNLYGLTFAKEAIRLKDQVVIVEGYLDLIMPFQQGLKNIVASLGTALTTDQVRLLKRYTSNAVMVYDADSAGEIATMRTLDILIEEGMDVRVVSLPKGYDPDSFVRRQGIEKFTQMIENAENLFDYKLKVLKVRFDATSIEGKAKISSEMLSSIKKFKNEILKSEYIKKLSSALDINEGALLSELKKTSSEKRYAREFQPAVSKAKPMNPTEKLLIKLVLEENTLIDHIKESLDLGDFRDERAARIVAVMFDLVSQGKNIDPRSLTSHLDEDGIQNVISETTFLAPIPEQDRERVVEDCIQRMKSEKEKTVRHNLHQQIKVAQGQGDDDKLNRLMEKFHQLIKKG
ncbi:DNA primase [Candidatus Omnitrophota bacterium]